MRSRSFAGQCGFGQRRATASASRTVASAQIGQRSGSRYADGVGRSALAHDFHDLGNHVSGALDEDRVADAHVEAVDLVLVVQRRVLDGDAADSHGLEHRDRRQRSRASDGGRDVENARGLLARRELERDRPARGTIQCSKPLLQREVVDLHDAAVDLVGQGVARALEPLVEVERASDADARDAPRVAAEPELRQPGQELALRFHAERFLSPADAVDEELERARGGELRVELAQGSGGRVARIGEDLEALCAALVVQPCELGERHQDLASDFEKRRRGLAEQPQRDGAHRSQVVAHVFARAAIAARRSEHEATLFVDQLDRDAVVLRFDRVRELRGCIQVPAHARIEGLDLGRIHRVVEREHRDGMLDRPEAADRRSPDPLRGRVGGHPVRDSRSRAPSSSRKSRSYSASEICGSSRTW